MQSLLESCLRFLGLDVPMPFGRAPGWARLRALHLRLYPECAACGSRRNVVPHHIVPVHVDPERELDPDNLITLCEGPIVNCHLLFGHLRRSWARWNADVVEDCRRWRAKIDQWEE
jgi:hypothetical protein